MTKYKEIISTQLKPLKQDKDDYFKYEIATNNDFSLNEGVYTGYILIYNPETKTHISSSTIRIIATSNSDQDFSFAINENVLDELLNDMNTIRAQMKDYLNKMKKLTELNIQISADIQTKVGEINE